MAEFCIMILTILSVAVLLILRGMLRKHCFKKCSCRSLEKSSEGDKGPASLLEQDET